MSRPCRGRNGANSSRAAVRPVPSLAPAWLTSLRACTRRAHVPTAASAQLSLSEDERFGSSDCHLTVKNTLHVPS